jgi:HEAT repeat protein
MDYWRAMSMGFRELGYNPKPSDKVLDRLLAEVQKDPEKVYQFLNAFRGSKKAADLVKEIYDRIASGTESDRDRRAGLKRWLTYNSPYFSGELFNGANKVTDSNEYVTHQEELLALGRVDWDRAAPIVNRLYAGNQKVSRVLAQWALYRNALDNDSVSDIDRYRDELKAVVEDKTAADGMRDLALDALLKEKEWSGRDEWYYSLMADETLDDLRVGGATYTGLTTLMYYSSDEKYIDKMIELVNSDNKVVRTAAAKNLLQRISTNNPEVVKALLPWLADPKWLNQDPSGRSAIVSALERVKVPESVPALIAALDEKDFREATSYSNTWSNANVSAARAMANAANAVALAANTMAAASNVSATVANVAGSPGRVRTEVFYPLRSGAVLALANQADIRAAPALRRLLNESDGGYEKGSLVGALFRCGGFSVAEQVDALEHVARTDESFDVVGNAMSNAANSISVEDYRHMVLESRHLVITGGSESDVKTILGQYLARLVEVVNNDLARGVVTRIGTLERTDIKTANAMRKIILRWLGPAVNALLLQDLKKNKVDPDGIVRLLFARKELRENQQADVYDLRTGSQVGIGISACLLEDSNDYDAILNGTSVDAKTSMLACARLIRAQLPVAKVAENLRSTDKLLALAAERYLAAEDSVEARRLVLSRHPNEAMILGSTTAFYETEADLSASPFLAALFAGISPYHNSQSLGYYAGGYLRQISAETEKRLQQEVKQNPDMLGVYNWGENFVRIFKDKAVLSWEQDPARYRERVLTTEEFDNLKGFLTHYKADELPPFLSCASSECQTKEFLMLGRNGGRRLFVTASSLPPLFAELDRMFEEMRRGPSTIKYWAGKDVPGLEVLFADDNLDAIAVWKSGTDFRVLVADKARRVEIDAEIDSFGEGLLTDSDEDEGYDGEDERITRERSKREYENYAWFGFSGGTLGSTVTQPSQAEYIPAKDNLEIQPEDNQWKTRAGSIEVRADEKGLYKVLGGRATLVKSGSYSDLVITPNGRWVVATKSDDDGPPRLVRLNLLTNKEFVVDTSSVDAFRAIAYVASIDRIVTGPYEREYEYSEDGEKSTEDDGSGYSLLDPETGFIVAARGEVRPLAQQSYRALQPSANAFEFWAAVPTKDQTVVGMYNTRTFTFRPILKLPKIVFDSMDTWVDENEGKIYFVYEGQLLAAPIKVK